MTGAFLARMYARLLPLDSPLAASHPIVPTTPSIEEVS